MFILSFSKSEIVKLLSTIVYKTVHLARLNFIHAVRYKYGPEIFQNIWQLNENRDPDYNLRNSTMTRTIIFATQP